MLKSPSWGPTLDILRFCCSGPGRAGGGAWVWQEEVQAPFDRQVRLVRDSDPYEEGLGLMD